MKAAVQTRRVIECQRGLHAEETRETGVRMRCVLLWPPGLSSALGQACLLSPCFPCLVGRVWCASSVRTRLLHPPPLVAGGCRAEKRNQQREPRPRAGTTEGTRGKHKGRTDTRIERQWTAASRRLMHQRKKKNGFF